MQDESDLEFAQVYKKRRKRSLVTGNIPLGMLWFAVPMIVGNLLQQFYNIADTLIVGQFLGADALAAVGSAYTLMIFLDCAWEVGRSFPYSTEPGRKRC